MCHNLKLLSKKVLELLRIEAFKYPGNKWKKSRVLCEQEIRNQIRTCISDEDTWFNDLANPIEAALDYTLSLLKQTYDVVESHYCDLTGQEYLITLKIY